LKKCNFEGLSPLHIAAERGDVYTVQALIKSVPDREMVFKLLKQKTANPSESTALHLASANGHHALIEYILTSQDLTFQQLDDLLHLPDNGTKTPKCLTTNDEVKKLFKECNIIIRSNCMT